MSEKKCVPKNHEGIPKDILDKIDQAYINKENLTINLRRKPRDPMCSIFVVMRGFLVKKDSKGRIWRMISDGKD